MWVRAVIGWIFFCAAAAQALEPVTLRSRSGQFVVRGILVSSPVFSRGSNVTYVRLDPAVMTVTCERIKDAFLTEFDLPDYWRDPVGITLRPVEAYDEPVELWSTRYQDGWGYRMVMPDQMDCRKVVKTVVQVLLLELANRKARARSAEVPDWLTTGLAAHLETSNLGGLTLEPATSTVKHGRRVDPFVGTREILRASRALTIDQLSWPVDDQLAGADGGLYRECARLLVRELLRLPGGRECLRDMTMRLSQDLNWQTTFLKSFRSHFRKMMDLEKWWALTTTHFTGVDTTSLWTPEQTLVQLDEAMDLQAREGTNNLPGAVKATLQKLIAEWRIDRLRPVLENKIRLLHAVKLRAAHQFVPLLEDYRATLEEFLRSARMTYSAKEQPYTRRKQTLPETLQRLDHLDEQRERLRRSINVRVSEVHTR